MSNRIEFTLDNLVYNVFVNSSDNIEFVLPHKIPNYFDVKNVKDKTKIFNTDEITIKVFISTLEGLTTLPEIIITSQDKDTKVITHGSLKLVVNSLLSVTFTTIDGGASWLVNSCASTAESAEEAVRIAENAVEIAGEATNIADTAKTAADSAVTVANSAKSAADSAVTAADDAKTAADSAVTVANSAKSTAEDAKTAADTAIGTANAAQASTIINKQEIDKTNETVEGLTTEVTNLEGSVNTLSETVQQNTENIDKKVDIDEDGYIASKGTYIADQIFHDGYITISPVMSKNYITDKSTQVFMRGITNNKLGIADYGPYIGINTTAISYIETNYWYVLVVDIENKIEGWNPRIRTFYRRIDNYEKPGTFYARREPLSVGNYKLIFPIYVDENYQFFGFYGEQNVRDIVVGDVKLFKFYPMTTNAQKQHSYDLISYYTPYTSIENEDSGSTGYVLNLNIGFESTNTNEYGYVTIYNTDDHSWYIVPVNESTEQQNYRSLIVTSNNFTKTLLDDIQNLNNTINILNTKLQSVIDKQNEVVGGN